MASAKTNNAPQAVPIRRKTLVDARLIRADRTSNLVRSSCTNSFHTDSLLWKLGDVRNSTTSLDIAVVTDPQAPKRNVGGISDTQFVLSIGTIAGIFGLAVYLARLYLLP
jgi:hypothetical protein